MRRRRRLRAQTRRQARQTPPQPVASTPPPPTARRPRAATAAADTTETTDAGAEETTPAEPTKSPITIGMAVGETGASGSTQQVRPTRRRSVGRARQRRARRDQRASRSTLVVKDTKSDGATGAAVVRELVEQDNALVLLSVDSASESAYGEYTQQQNIPVIGVGYSPATWIALPNWFATSTTIPAVVQAQFVSAKEVGATTWGVVSCIEVASCAASEPLWEPSAAQVGIEFGGGVSASTTAPNYTAECLQLIDAGVDYVQLSMAPAAGEKIAADCRRQGYEGWFGATRRLGGRRRTSPTLSCASPVRCNGFPWFVDAEPVQPFLDAMEAGRRHRVPGPDVDRHLGGARAVPHRDGRRQRRADTRRGVPGLLRPAGRGPRRPAARRASRTPRASPHRRSAASGSTRWRAASSPPSSLRASPATA